MAETVAEASSAHRLIERIQAGDPDAFGELYTCYQPVVYRYLFRRLAHQQKAEDLTQDVFVRALGSVDRYTWRGHDPGAWLVTIARNRLHDEWTCSRNRRERLVDQILEGPEPESSGPERLALAAAAERDLIALLNELTPDQREALLLRYWCDLSLAEVAGVMGRSEGAIKVLVVRARRSMARLLNRGPW